MVAGKTSHNVGHLRNHSTASNPIRQPHSLLHTSLRTFSKSLEDHLDAKDIPKLKEALIKVRSFKRVLFPLSCRTFLLSLCISNS